MADILDLAAPTPAQSAFARIFTLATWAFRRGDEFTFREVAVALGDAYEGTFQAVDRRWSRDKRDLAALGLPLSPVGGNRYRFEPTRRRPGLDPGRAAALVAAVRDLPARDEVLERALRKVLAHGAPILGALMARPSSGCPAPRDTVTRALSIAHLLVLVLQAAGDEGLSLDEAVAAGGARDAAELGRVVALLGALKLPFDGVDDSLPVLIEGGRIDLYALGELLPRPAFTPAEVRALEGAGLMDTVRPFTRGAPVPTSGTR